MLLINFPPHFFLSLSDEKPQSCRQRSFLFSKRSNDEILHSKITGREHSHCKQKKRRLVAVAFFKSLYLFFVSHGKVSLLIPGVFEEKILRVFCRRKEHCQLAQVRQRKQQKTKNWCETERERKHSVVLSFFLHFVIFSQVFVSSSFPTTFLRFMREVLYVLLLSKHIFFVLFPGSISSFRRQPRSAVDAVQQSLSLAHQKRRSKCCFATQHQCQHWNVIVQW